MASFRVFRRGISLLWAHRLRFSIGLVCVPGFALLSLAMPGIVKRAIDALSIDEPADRRAQLLWLSCLAFAGVAAAEALLRFLARKLLIEASRLTEERLKANLMAHIGSLPLAWFNKARIGDLLSRLTQDVELVRFVLGPFPLYFLQALVVIPGAVILMWGISPLVTSAVAGAFGLLAIALGLVLPRMQKHSKRVQEAVAAISSRAAEDFSGVRVLMNFAKVRQQTAVFARLADDYLQHNMRSVRFRALLNLCIHSASDLVVVALVILGGREAIAGRITPGQLFEFLMLFGMITWPMLATGYVLATLHQAVAGAQRIEELFAHEPETSSGQRPALTGAIHVRNLTFHHAGSERPALQDVSFDLAAGHKLGIVGPVGSGKSTLLAMLLRLHDPPRGTVFVDGHDVLDLDLTTLRNCFAVAPQDPFLFSDTIRGNVAFAIDGVDTAVVDDAVHVSALAQDLPDLAEGLETIIGERGITLSGGQKQRVSLARALASGRGTLILDDTLSAVDHQTEAAILARLKAKRGGRTLLVAAHRLSAVADADCILFLRQGRAVEQGTHPELLRRQGEYAAAWNRQQEAQALEGQPLDATDGVSP